jgi:two-component system sensor histidine kinase KdpD
MQHVTAKVNWRGYAGSLAVVAACTLLAWAMTGHFELSNLIMVYLLGVVATAVRWGRGPSVLASLLAVGAFDFFFVPPRFSFEVADAQYTVTFAVMLIVGLVVSQLTTRLRQQAQVTAEAQLHVENERLRNSLLAAISHELRTPLAAIIGASSSLAEEDARLDAESKRSLGRDILEASRRMHELMNKVLEMARLQSGRIELKMEWYPLEEIIGSVLLRLRDRLVEHPVSVELPATAPWIWADGSLIEQVLANLIENAVKYTVAGTPIHVRARPVGDALEAEVADEGPGLPTGTEEQVFEKFYQAKREGAGGGVGLGLSICRIIVEAHGGSIRAVSAPQGGARFIFSLPVKGSPPGIEAAQDE